MTGIIGDMALDITACASTGDLAAALTPIMHYFGGTLGPDDIERWSRTIDPARMIAARESGEVVGGAGAFTFELTVPGGLVRAAGVTVVGVLPTHRRRGILQAMMRCQLDDVHRRGEPVACLWASEETIYGRFGYGLSSVSGQVEIPRATNAFARPFERRGEARLASEEEALASFPPIYDAVRRERPGMFSRTSEWWLARRLGDPERRRGGGGPLNRLLITIDGEPSAYALYRIHQSFEAGVSTGFVNVVEAVGATFEGTRDLWRGLLDIDWISQLHAFHLPIDHPLWFLLARPRTMKMRLGDALWVRLVDVEKALAARTFAAGDGIVFEVADEFCPWNAGRYEVGANGVSRTTRAPDLVCGVTALGSVYLGGFEFRQLARAGLVTEASPRAAARADAIFTRDLAPWCPEVF